VLVVGERELAGGDLSVRPRLGELMELTLDAFVERLAADTAGKPPRPANTPRLLSRRPVFLG
jgi:threonyl-tRNA synthetase